MKTTNYPSHKKIQQFASYLLTDYQFLDDYEAVDVQKRNQNSFVANIKDTNQKVRFVKTRYCPQFLPRFKSLHKLHKNGIILADNMFILQQCEQYYFYIIQAETSPEDIKFTTLQHYLFRTQLTLQERIEIITKIKVLIDCLHQQGQTYSGIDTRKIIIDEDKQIYLAPYQLEIVPKYDNFSRAYYPPEIILSLNQKTPQISEESMIKWDIWSFGCICLEILVYSSPVFMSTSAAKQLKMIKSFSLQGQIIQVEPQIRRIVENSLKQDPSLRTISTSRITASIRPQQSYFSNVQTLTLNTLHQQQQPKIKIRQLNVHPQSDGPCIFTLQLLSLSNISFEKQLHVTIHIGKKFHFFIDFQQQTKKYHINRKITIKDKFDALKSMLSKTIVVELNEQQRRSQIRINAQALIITQDNKRVWNEPLIGSYKVAQTGFFKQGRMRINCSLITPEDTVFDELEKIKNDKKIAIIEIGKDKQNQNQPKKQSNHTKVGCQNILMEIDHNLMPQKTKCLKPAIEKIPSISQISQSLTLLNQELKRKLGSQQKTTCDPIKLQLSDLLELN